MIKYKESSMVCGFYTVDCDADTIEETELNMDRFEKAMEKIGAKEET